MDSRVLEVWRLAWPNGIPPHEYETALQFASLTRIIGREPDAPPERASITPADAITAQEAAKILGVSPATVYLWAKTGKLKPQQGERLVFSRKDVDAFKATRAAS